MYPIFFDVRGICVQEPNGNSRINAHNISCTIGTIRKHLAKLNLRLGPVNFGIASPYSAQQREARKALWKAGLGDIKVGTAEHWQGKEADIMFVDLVRAGNDHGDLCFVSKKERLDVLLSRQKQMLFAVGDTTCCDTGAVPPETEETNDEPPTEEATASFDSKKNQFMISVSKLFEEKGRVSTVAMDKLTEEFVRFPKQEELNEGAGMGSWDDEQSAEPDDAEYLKENQEEEEELKEEKKEDEKKEKKKEKKKKKAINWECRCSCSRR